jgi:hypothetical protein
MGSGGWGGRDEAASKDLSAGERFRRWTSPARETFFLALFSDFMIL